MKKTLWIVGFLLALLVALYLLGPTAAPFLPNPEINSEGQSLSEKLRSEAETESILPGCISILRYANDSSRNKTPFVLLYLHGFSASPLEGDPLMFDISSKFTMNLYAPRLAAHGLKSEENLSTFTAEGWIESVKEAIQQASTLGDSIIIMCTSTGGTAGLFLSNSHPKIHSLICYSPNTELARKESDILLYPWGLQIGRLISGGKNYNWKVPASGKNYWYDTYRVEAIIQLKRLLKGTMTDEVFQSVSKPLFVGYYFKNENEKDDQVSIERMEEMFDLASTPDDKKWFVNFKAAGSHCIPSRHFSKDLPAVEALTERFIKEILEIQPQSGKLKSNE